MTGKAFVEFVRNAQKRGVRTLRADLTQRRLRCAHCVIEIDGRANGNPHDLWFLSLSRRTILGRAYLGSKNMKRNLEGWPAIIANLEEA